MTVGLLTFHWQDDYGAALQAYALRRAVVESGHTPVFIDLCLPYAPTQWQRMVSSLRHRRFEEFRRLFLTPLSLLRYTSLQDLRRNPPLCDCYLTGGPMVWNPETAGNALAAYFLAFGPESTRRIAYAPTIGLDSWMPSPVFGLPEISRSLSRFSSILLPEKKEIDICRNAFGQSAFHVADPILLFSDYPDLDAAVFRDVEVVVYSREGNAAAETAARDYSVQKGLPLRIIGSGRFSPESVTGWFASMANAALILTDTMIAIEVALLYHRPFVAFQSDTADHQRIRALLELLGLSQRLLPADADQDSIRAAEVLPMDWTAIDRQIGALRADSWRLLRLALI